MTGVLSSVAAAVPGVLSTRGPGCQGPSLRDRGSHRSPQPEHSCVAPSPHPRGCAGGPRPAPRGAACYSAQVRRWLMKLVPGELPHSSAERLINEASATAAGASARGTGTGTGRADGRMDGRTARWQLVPVLAELLVQSWGCSRAGHPNPGSALGGPGWGLQHPPAGTWGPCPGQAQLPSKPTGRMH